jgi:RNA polymerase sigma factor (TIGR02999 family)
MNDITRILADIHTNPSVAQDLLAVVYEELRRLAAAQMRRESSGHTLQPTALVHEAYLRLMGTADTGAHWQGRAHFFAAAAEAMRRILVESARRKHREKHGGQFARSYVEVDALALDAAADPLEVLAVHEALDELATKSPRKAELTKLRYFVGCTLPEAAQILGISTKTAEADWTYTRTWLRRYLLRGGQSGPVPQAP